MNPLKKHSFLGIVCISLSFICSLIAAEKAVEGDFEASWNRSFCNALEAFGQEKFKELGLEDPIEKQRQETERRQRLEQEAAEAKKKIEAEQQRAKAQIEAELRAKKALFAIRGSMIDECIKTYNELASPYLHYVEFYGACMRIYPLYDKRQKEKRVEGLEIVSLENIYKVFWMKEEGRANIRQHMTLGAAYIRQYYGIVTLESKQGLPNAIKDDVIETMEIYEKLYEQPHPRWEEFSKIMN
jgi:hypothetical protein